MENASIPLTAAFLAGFLSFLSPCVLPMLPTFFALLGGCGVSSRDQSTISAGRFFSNVLFFLSGFTVVFVAMGATASYFGQMFVEYQDRIRQAGAIFMLLMGLQLLGWFRIRALKREYRPFLADIFHGPWSAFILGIGFTAGWTPCTGPILAGILAYAGTNTTVSQGMWLLLAFSLGFSLPFWGLALVWQRAVLPLRRLYPWLPLIQKLAGSLMILLGLALYFDLFARLIGLFV